MQHVHSYRPAGEVSDPPIDTVTLPHDLRHLRRKLLHLSNGDMVMLDLKEAVLFHDGDRLVLDNGERILPIFHCLPVPGEEWKGQNDVSAVKISADQGKTWSEYPVPESKGAVHMNIVQRKDGSLAAFFRSRYADNIMASSSTDNGRTWSKPVATALPNNNSSIQVRDLG